MATRSDASRDALIRYIKQLPVPEAWRVDADRVKVANMGKGGEG